MTSKFTHSRVLSTQPQVSRRDLVGGMAVGAIAVAAAGAAQAATGGTMAASRRWPCPGSPSPSMPPALPNDQPAEVHQLASGDHPNLTTNQGIVVADNQNSLRVGTRGPTLLEDFVLREKITHFDHERIPERVVHARGYGAHGYFEVTHPLTEFSRADLFQRAGERTEVFARFSTVAGNKGSADLARDVRGFAVKFYTKQGNWDLVGNNIPVFFIQDAIKFPDLIHAAKQEPDRAFPQAQTAHDTFWDYISLTPESMHMIMWIMSDRAIPRSFRMMEGFGVHTFRLINAEGAATFVKFHWRPKLGSQSVVWDEALKINGADPDFHRRDFGTPSSAATFRNGSCRSSCSTRISPTSSTSTCWTPPRSSRKSRCRCARSAGWCWTATSTTSLPRPSRSRSAPRNIVPGIDFTNDPLLQGRNFSYLDTQLKRLGGPNFHQIPVNAPRCPMANFQRDGHMQMQVPKGRVAYEPNSLSKDGPRENPEAGFATFPQPLDGQKLRHPLGNLRRPFQPGAAVLRQPDGTGAEPHRLRAHLRAQQGGDGSGAGRDAGPAGQYRAGAGGPGGYRPRLRQPIEPARAARPTRTDLKPSPALSILAKAPKTLQGRKVGILVDDGTDTALVKAVTDAVAKAGGQIAVISPKVGGATGADGSIIPADFQLAGGPSVLFDAVAILVSSDAGRRLTKEAAAVAFAHDAFAHLKVIGHSAGSQPLLQAAGVMPDEGIVALDGSDGSGKFATTAAAGRIWAREPKVRTVY